MTNTDASRGAALVTGAARRIGRAIALELGRAGFDVAVHHNNSGADAADTVREIEALGRRAVALQADLTNESAARRLVPDAAAALGPLTVLVNNASVFEDDRVGGLSRDSWDRHMETNLRAPIVLAEEFPALAPDGSCLVNLLEQRVRERTLELEDSSARCWGCYLAR